MASKVINTILNLRDQFSPTIQNVAKNTDHFRKSMGQTQNQAISMKKTVSDALGTIKDSMLRGIGFGAGMDIFENMKDSIVETVTFGNELQKSLNGIQSATGISDGALGSLKNTMVDIYNDNFGENFQEIGEAITSISQQTGASGDSLKGLTENAFALKDAFNMEVNESTRSASMLMKQFGIDGNQAYNLIAQGAQQGLNKRGDLLDIIEEYSVQFKKVGLGAEDMFNAIKAGADSGAFSMDILSDGLKEFAIRAVDGSKTTIDGFTQLGFSADDMAKKFGQGGDMANQAFKDMIGALANVKDPLKQNQVGVELFGTKWEDLGAKSVMALASTNNSISQTKDTLGQINKIKYNDIGSAFEGIKRNIQTSILIPISDAVLPRLNDFANWFKNNIPNIKENISGVVNNFLNVAASISDKVWPSLSNLIDSVKDLSKTVYDSILPAFDSVKPDNWTSVGDAIKDIVNKATEVVKYVNDNWPTIKPVIEDIISAMVAWKLATMAVNTWITITTAAQWALNFALNANPIGVIIMAIAGLGFAIYEVIKHWKDIYNWITWVWGIIEKNPILHFLSYVLNPFGSLLMDIITHWKDISTAIGNAWDKLKNFWDWWNNTSFNDKNINVTESINQEKLTQGATSDFADTFNAAYNAGNNATGTNYWRGGRTWVGERGPELIDLPGGSKVYTNSQSKQMSNGQSQVIINFNVSGNMIGEEEFFNRCGQHVFNQIQLSMVNS